MTQFIHLLAEAHHFLVLLEKHREKEDLEGQDVSGICGSGKVLAGSGKEIIQGNLVRTAQRSPKTGKRGIGLIELLRYGGKSATHEDLPLIR
jgi:hypothetical protein